MCSRIHGHLYAFVNGKQLGSTLCNDPGFILERGPDTLRGPDVAFMSKARALSPREHAGFLDGVPDLAIEILGPTAPLPEALRKTAQYLQAGCPLVWIVDITHQRVLEFTGDGVTRTLSIPDTLDGRDILPGFFWPLTDLFADF
jgi:Uma2 family endonuclease